VAKKVSQKRQTTSKTDWRDCARDDELL